jgi:predicted DNA-binding transcriptional regulator YafY
MPRHFSRHEQFLRIFALLDILSNAHAPIDDHSLIAQLKERLGLSRLSPRTLHRDCEFLLTCGYPVDRAQLPGDRRAGWHFARQCDASRKIPPEPLTLLELVAFEMGRDLMRPFEGTVLWTGIEALRHRLEKDTPDDLQIRLKDARRVFAVEGGEEARYANRPRLISTLSTAITDCREIELTEQDPDGNVSRHRLQPHRLVIRPPTVELLAYPTVESAVDGPLRLDLSRIQKVTALDVTFVPRSDGLA